MEQPAARLLDPIEHTEAKTGFLTGALVGLAVGVAIVAATVATGGAALAVVAAAGAGVAATGGGALLGQALGETVTTTTGEIIQVGSPNVQVESRPAARAKLDGAKCDKHAGPPSPIAQGSSTVHVNGQPAARKTELTQCSGKIADGAASVIIGGETATVLPISPEVPTWMTSLATAMVWVGSAVALGAGAAAAYAAAGVCGLATFGLQAAGGIVGGLVGGVVGGDVGEALFGERGRIVGTALGGMLGGFGGARLGGRTAAGHPVDVASGELFTEHTDFAVSGVLPLEWRRVWMSSSTRGAANGGPLGEGWHHSFDVALAPLPDGSGLAARLADGRFALFSAPTPLRPSLNTVERLVLTVDVRDTYRLTGYDGVVHEFGPADPRTGVRPLARVADANGNAIVLEHVGGRLVALTDSAGRTFDVESDAQGRVVAVHGPHPERAGQRMRLVAYEYDGHGDLVRAVDARGSAFTYRYDNHLLVEEGRPSGVAFQFVWDDPARGREARCVDTWGRRPSDGPGRFHRPIYRAVLAYDVAARTTAVTNGEGARRRYRWNDLHLVEESVDPLGHVTRYAYDAAGRLTSEAGPEGHAVRQVYDALGRPTVRVDAAGTTRLAYAIDATTREGLAAGLPLDRVTQVTLPDGARRTFAYDARGNLAAETDPTGRTTAYVRDGRGLLVEARDALGTIAEYRWSPAGELLAEGPEEAPRRRYAHDRLGRVTMVQRGSDVPLRIRRDAVGNVVSVRRGDDHVAALEYDADGRVTVHRDPLGRTTQWRYDGLPFPVERVSADGARMRYAYDSELRLVALTNAKGERYRLAYDPAGRLVEEVGFDGRSQRHAVDALGRLVATTDAGRVTRFRRDRAGRLVGKELADGTAHRFAWDAAGRLTRAESPDAVVSWVYDAAGRVLEERLAAPDRGALPVHYRYDARGRLTDTVLPDGRTLAIEYGADDLFAALSLAGDELARVERDAVGREVTRRAGAVTQTQEFDPQGRLLRQAGTTGGRRTVFARGYGYDAADQIVRVTDSARGERTYEYDACERLLGVGGDAPERFVVDPAGNILARDAAAPGGDAAPGDRLLRYRDGGEERTFEYDAHGNRVRERRAVRGADPVEVAYRYGADDQLREVRRRAGGTETVTRFGYDALGRRVWKAAARLAAAATLAVGMDAAAAEPPDEAWVRTAFLWTGDVLLAESTRPLEDPLATVYAYEPGTFRPLALVRRAAFGASQAVHHYHLDHLGTPQELTAGDGRVVWAAEYRAWGAAAHGGDAGIAQPLRFQGQYADVETGLHYNRFRYYSPDEGRFVTQDPVGLLGGENLAAYALNPVQGVDPFGLTPVYRNLNDTDDPMRGLTARRPGRGMTPAGHVMNGSKPTFKGSQYISTTTDPDVAARWQRAGQRTVMIDVDKLQPDAAGNRGILDVSTPEGADAHGLRGRARSNALSSREILLEGRVPPEAMTDVTDDIRNRKAGRFC